MDEIWRPLAQAINDGNAQAATAEATHLAETGIPPVRIFSECIEPCLKEVGERFARLEIFLPEMIDSAEAVKAVQAVLKPYLLSGKGPRSKGRIVLGTITGDLHDIGKNIVKTMLEVNGFEVLDLGVGVPGVRFLSAACEFNADIIAISALMLPSLPYMRDAIELVHRNRGEAKCARVMIGGGPVTAEWARQAGADAYGRDAQEAVKIASQLAGKPEAIEEGGVEIAHG